MVYSSSSLNAVVVLVYGFLQNLTLPVHHEVEQSEIFKENYCKISSQGDSETEGRSPSKRIARSPSIDSVDDDSVTFGSSVITSTQIKVSLLPSRQILKEEKNCTPCSFLSLV